MKNKDMYNQSGYLDMTAYLAIRNIEQQENAKRAEPSDALTSSQALLEDPGEESK